MVEPGKSRELVQEGIERRNIAERFPFQQVGGKLDVAAGIPAADVLQLATLGAARIMKHDADLGAVAPGKLADLVVVNGDPTKEISDIRKIEIVVKDGTVYRSADLYRAVGIHP